MKPQVSAVHWALQARGGGAAPHSWSVPDSGALWPDAEWVGFRIRAACAEQAAELNETQIEIAVVTKCLLTE